MSVFSQPGLAGGHYLWVGSCLLAAIAAAGCGGEPEAAATNAPGPPSVHVIHPQPRSIDRVIAQPSFVESYERSSVYPKLSGYIDSWDVDIGDRVKKGDVLAKLFVPELREDLETKKRTVELDVKRVRLAKEALRVAQADVKAAKARLEEAKALVDKYKSDVTRWDSEVTRLAREVKRGVVDPQVLLESRNQLGMSTAAWKAALATVAKADAEVLSKEAAAAQAEVAVETASAELSVARSEEKRVEALVGYLVLPAPFDGIIVVRNANTFDFVLPAAGDPTAMPRSPGLSPGGRAAPVYVVDRTDIVRIFVDIPEHDANFVHAGSPASVLIQAYRDEPISASVTRTAWALNVKSRTLRAEIDLPNTDGKILPGMYAYGFVSITHPNVFAVPRGALDYRGETTFFWSSDNGRAVKTEVQTGVADDEWVELTRRRPAGMARVISEKSKAGPGAKEAQMAADAKSWRPIDGSEQVIVGDLTLLADKEPVQLAPEGEGEEGGSGSPGTGAEGSQSGTGKAPAQSVHP
jgi:multidrug efflux pump subunit AcrA (membrane-fusion protein)